MTTTATDTTITLRRDSNQALGIGRFAVDFMRNGLGDPSEAVRRRTIEFFADSILCGLSALALKTNAPNVLRDEAMRYPDGNGATVMANADRVLVEKAIVANCSAVREWDSNGTNFGFNPGLGHTAGEFGHNDFYGVAVAAAQTTGANGEAALRGMICIDEIRGRLAEVFSLKSYKIDHVVHGAVGSAAVFGAMHGATPEQIESAIGMFVAHYIPWRAIRAGKQLSDSKGASAAISTEAAVLCMRRSMNGFIGPKDIFRNPEAIWRQFEPTDGDCPFDLVLSHSGDDFAVMGMHFKLGLYEHQSAGALHAMITMLCEHPELLTPNAIASIKILAYEPAFGIIGDPAKADPRTRQSADHSMMYIVATALRKALELARSGTQFGDVDEAWKAIMLAPEDYGADALFNEQTRDLMSKIGFAHGGSDYDDRYPDGIPTSLVMTTADGKTFDSGLVMYPAGHARNTDNDLQGILAYKFQMLGTLVNDDPNPLIERLMNVATLSADDLMNIYDCTLNDHPPVD